MTIPTSDWRRLGPVRAYAENLGLPVEMANEKLPSVWRLREMQKFIAGLRGRPSAMLTIQDLLDVLNEQPSNRWVGRRDGKWMVLDRKGRVLGRMAGNWGPPERTRMVSGKVGAIVRWRKADNDERYQTYIRQDEWETVLPELVFRKSE